MTARVKWSRTKVATGRVLAGYPVTGKVHSDLVDQVNYLIGFGKQVIPIHCPNVGLNFKDDGVTNAISLIKYHIPRKSPSLKRRWTLVMEGNTSADGTGTPRTAPGVIVTIPNSTTFTMDVPGTPTVFTFEEEHDTQTGTEDNVDLSIENPNVVTTSVWCRLVTVGCKEYHRRSLESSEGTDVTLDAPGQPITLESMGAVNAMNTDVSDTFGRVLVSWAVPYSFDGGTVTDYSHNNSTASYKAVFSKGVPVLSRQINSSGSTASLTPYVAIRTNGGSADVQATSTVNGSNTAKTINTSGAVTITALNSVTVNTEDLTASDGLRSSTHDIFNVQTKTNTGTSVNIFGVFLAE